MLSLVNGWKTYATAAGMALVAFGEQLGWITHDEGQQILQVLGILAVVFIRHAIAKATILPPPPSP